MIRPMTGSTAGPGPVPAPVPTPVLTVDGVAKTFTMHLQGGQRLAVLDGLSFVVGRGESVVLGGPSGAGKSTVLKLVYGNYQADRGRILVHGTGPRGEVDIVTAAPRAVLAARLHAVGYVSQFLRCVPRVGTLDVVAEPLVARGVDAEEARDRAARMLTRLSIPERLWSLPPATFSGGEQQRVNVARGFLPELPLLLLDEPTASLDARNRDVVVELIAEKRDAGVGMLGIFHDAEVRAAVADRIVDVEAFVPALTGAAGAVAGAVAADALAGAAR
ncbi:Alpha-D-ribose 1-methylphosphonate 5-triphosphate synthase subunit PhnL [Clavibacter michiganensis]|uniref:Alpha-D-ribose 1-methylphosphonate 5-triphosphate synthase subunit PhnL n=2 Tax=Clavibacter michiganensis TaxID=28447 RepID=A0A251YLB6_9MICO|nr:Alpha-D-ribose 1-methylphosphonate 5-triphosphate synthase subunit PhnL [Clavibacter michiganensis]